MGPRCSSAETQVCHRSYIIAATKYPLLEQIVKTALVLPHGNADVERSLSVNVNVVTEDRTQLSEHAFNGIRMVKDAVTFFDPKDNKPKNIPFTKELTTAMKTAHASYQARLEEERNKRDFEMSKAKEKREMEERLKRKQEEETAAGKKIELRESECFEKEKQVRIDMDAANVLLKEGKHKLEAIMREKEIHRPSLQAAQMMIDTATNKTEQALKELEKIRDKQKEIEKEKTSILNKASASRGAREESKTESTRHSGKHHEHGSITKKESSLGKANNKGSEKTHGKDAIVIARQSASEEKTEDVNKRKTSEKTKRKSETTGSHEDVERKKRKSETTGSHEDVERKKGKSETTGSHEDVERKKQKHK